MTSTKPTAASQKPKAASAKAPLFSQAGEKKGDVALPEALFAQKVNRKLLHEFVLLQAANARHAIASVKTRAERAGSRKKPHRQKGTGRARLGAVQAAHVRKGGRVHGPSSDRNFSKEMPKKMRRAALLSALSARAAEKAIFALENFSLPEPKTREAAALLAKLPAKRSLLVVFPENDVAARKSWANLPNVKTLLADFLNPRDLLQFEKVCFLKEAIGRAESRFGKKEG